MESDWKGRLTTIQYMTQPEMTSMYNHNTLNTKYFSDPNYSDQDASIHGEGMGGGATPSHLPQ